MSTNIFTGYAGYAMHASLLTGYAGFTTLQASLCDVNSPNIFTGYAGYAMHASLLTGYAGYKPCKLHCVTSMVCAYIHRPGTHICQCVLFVFALFCAASTFTPHSAALGS
jgi:hypothetical protein